MAGFIGLWRRHELENIVWVEDGLADIQVGKL